MQRKVRALPTVRINIALSIPQSLIRTLIPVPIPLLGLTDERLLAAARDDNEDLLLTIFEEGGFDINCQDGWVLRLLLSVPRRC